VTEREPNAVCPYCGAAGGIVFVHGHGQCATCASAVEPCCAGADAGSEAAANLDHPAHADPDLFVRLFAHLGGASATVTEQALLHAIVATQDCDLDEARLVLQAGEHTGLLVASGPGCYRLRRAG